MDEAEAALFDLQKKVSQSPVFVLTANAA